MAYRICIFRLVSAPLAVSLVDSTAGEASIVFGVTTLQQRGGPLKRKCKLEIDGKASSAVVESGTEVLLVYDLGSGTEYKLKIVKKDANAPGAAEFVKVDQGMVVENLGTELTVQSDGAVFMRATEPTAKGPSGAPTSNIKVQCFEIKPGPEVLDHELLVGQPRRRPAVGARRRAAP